MSFGLFRIFFATGGWGWGFTILQLPSLPLSLTETPSLHWKRKKKKKSHRLFYIIPRSFFPDGLVKELKCVPLVSCYVWKEETGAISSWLQLLCFLPFGALREVLESWGHRWIVELSSFDSVPKRSGESKDNDSVLLHQKESYLTKSHSSIMENSKWSFEGTVSLKVKILYLIVDSRVVLKTSWKDTGFCFFLPNIDQKVSF